MTDKPSDMVQMPDFLGPVVPITIETTPRGLGRTTPTVASGLELVVGIAVVNTGHCHPKVVEAVQEQAAKVAHVR